MKLLLALALAAQAAPSALPLPEAVPAVQNIQIARCDRCGCRGGPGWRIHRTGQCAGKANLAKECGRPPSPALCTKEN